METAVSEFKVGQFVRLKLDADFSAFRIGGRLDTLRQKRTTGVVCEYDEKSVSALAYRVEFDGQIDWYAAAELEAALDGKTPAEIEALKASWSADPCWDIEDTPGFEAHRLELLAFHKAKQAEWSQAHSQRITDSLNHADALYESIGMSDEGNLALAAFVGKLVLKNKAHIIEALKALDARG